MKKILIIIICGILLSPAITHAKEIVKTEEIYVRTINMYDRFGNIIDSFEDVLEKEEYEQELSISTASANNCAGQFYPYCYATEYKTLRLKYYYDDLEKNEYSVVALLTWEKEPLYDKAYTEEYKVSIFDLLAVTVVVTATLSLICDILGFLRRLFR